MTRRADGRARPPGRANVLPARGGTRPAATAHREAALILAVGIAMAAFYLASSTLALDRPVPRHVRTALVGEAADASGLAEKLNARTDGALDYRAQPSAEAAYRAIGERRVSAALILDPFRARLLIAGADGASMARQLRDAASGIEHEGSAGITVIDVRPLPESDRAGLAGYFAMVAASLLGLLTTLQLRVNDPRLGPRSWAAAITMLAVVGGFVLAVLIGPVTGALPAAVTVLWAILSAQITVAALFGTLMGLVAGRWAIVPTWLLFTALGNPASGGPVPAPLLPQPYAAISEFHPDGVTVDLLRIAAYFPDAGSLRPALVEASWLVGLLGLILLTARRARSTAGNGRPDVPPGRAPADAVGSRGSTEWSRLGPATTTSVSGRRSPARGGPGDGATR